MSFSDVNQSRSDTDLIPVGRASSCTIDLHASCQDKRLWLSRVLNYQAEVTLSGLHLFPAR